MKSSLLFVSLFLSSVAFAYPAVHDQAVFNGVYQGGGGTMTFQQTLELTSVQADVFNLHVSYVLEGGKTDSSDQAVKAQDLLTNSAVQEILSQCVAGGGALESLTVPAGTFQTCAIAQGNNGKVWVGDATFGIIKQIQIDQDGNIITTELASFVNGQ